MMLHHHYFFWIKSFNSTDLAENIAYNVDDDNDGDENVI